MPPRERRPGASVIAWLLDLDRPALRYRVQRDLVAGRSAAAVTPEQLAADPDVARVLSWFDAAAPAVPRLMAGLSFLTEVNAPGLKGFEFAATGQPSRWVTATAWTAVERVLGELPWRDSEAP